MGATGPAPSDKPGDAEVTGGGLVATGGVEVTAGDAEVTAVEVEVTGGEVEVTGSDIGGDDGGDEEVVLSWAVASV